MHPDCEAIGSCLLIPCCSDGECDLGLSEWNAKPDQPEHCPAVRLDDGYLKGQEEA